MQAGATTSTRPVSTNAFSFFSQNLSFEDQQRFVIGNNVFAPRSGTEEHWMYAATLRSKNPSGWNYEAAASLYDIKEQVLRTSNEPRDVAYSTGSAGTLSRLDGSGWWHIGFKADLDLDGFLAQASLTPMSIEKVNVPRMWTLVTCEKPA